MPIYFWPHIFFKSHFYIVKLGFTGVYIICPIFAQNIDCRYSLEPPRRGGSNEYPQSMFWAKVWKISEFFIWIFFQFLEVKFSIYLNRRVFLMKHYISDQRRRWSGSADTYYIRLFPVWQDSLMITHKMKTKLKQKTFWRFVLLFWETKTRHFMWIAC